MRMHIDMDEDLVHAVDEIAGARGRSRFVREAVFAAVEARRRAEALVQAYGAISGPHEWDEDPPAWVRAQRRLDPRRVG